MACALEDDPCPQDGAPGEVLSATQPFPVVPAPIVPSVLKAEDAFGNNTKQVNISTSSLDTHDNEAEEPPKKMSIADKLRGTVAPPTKSKRAMKSLQKKNEKENAVSTSLSGKK